jgi:uncharacterized cupredoxin-like copper-binding protein
VKRGVSTTAIFALAVMMAASASAASVHLSISGDGLVKANGKQLLACERACSAAVTLPNKKTVVAAITKPGWRFDHWSGRCVGSGTTCQFTPGGTTSLRAVFTPIQPPAPTITPSTTVQVSIKNTAEFSFNVSTQILAVGTVVFNIANGGNLPHDLEICSTPGTLNVDSCDGSTSPIINPGAAATFSVTFTAPGSYEYLCPISGHAAAGMKGFFVVS